MLEKQFLGFDDHAIRRLIACHLYICRFRKIVLKSKPDHKEDEVDSNSTVSVLLGCGNPGDSIGLQLAVSCSIPLYYLTYLKNLTMHTLFGQTCHCLHYYFVLTCSVSLLTHFSFLDCRSRQ